MAFTPDTLTTEVALPEPPDSEPSERARAEAQVSQAVALDNTTPGTLDRPAYLLNCPFSYSAERPNNAWMQELDDEHRRVDRSKAMCQFAQLYDRMSSDAFVFLLPTPARCTLQDLVFTANLGIVLEHIPERNIVVLSNYTSEPRVGETDVGRRFFRAMGYTTYVAPYRFEGEAELKHLHDNVYVGGYGIRSDRKVYEWMEAEFDMQVIKVEEVDEYLYHLDCSIFPITSDDTLVCTGLFDRAEISRIEKATNIIDVSVDVCYSGICNSVRHHNSILNSSHIHGLRAGSEDYFEELKKNRELEDVAVKLGLEINYFNLSEYHKGGALLSCMVMHLNRRSYSFSLI
jgi:N-dimethylarginine dimethylaminohydrolase